MKLIWEVNGETEVFPFCVTTELVEEVLGTEDQDEQLNSFRKFLRNEENREWVKITIDSIYERLENRNYKLVKA